MSQNGAGKGNCEFTKTVNNHASKRGTVCELVKLVLILSETTDKILKTFTVWLVLCSVNCNYYRKWSVRFFWRNFFWIGCLSAFKNYSILKGRKTVTSEVDSQVLW